MLNLVIAPTRAADAEQIVSLTRAAGVLAPERVAALRDWVNDYLAQGAASMYRFLSCHQNGQVIGYSCYGPRWLTESAFDLYAVGVAPACQRRGVATALLRQTERDICVLAGNLVLVEVSGLPGWQPVRCFFEARGYHIEATIADFYADGDDQILYSKRLNPPDYGVEADLLAARHMKRLQKQALGYAVED